MTPVDILILSNGPGEVTTWVRPVVKALRKQLGNDRSQVRISVILSPCPHASGKEAAIAKSYPEVDRVQASEHFWQFLIWGKTAQNWDWRNQGVVVFLGGDQIFPVIIGKKLGYKTVVYAEWEARWHNFIDKFAIMKPEVAKNVPPKYTHKFTVVGDLMLEAAAVNIKSPSDHPQTKDIIGLLPGSKSAKLTQGVPLELAIAEYIHSQKPETKFLIPVAPTLDLSTLANFANPEHNQFTKAFNFQGASLIDNILITSTGLEVELKQENPAYHLLSQCAICLTTVGANTAELGALGVPMIILLPTQQLDAMRSWDGLPGLLANLPGIGSSFAKLINWWFLRRKGLLAWPNIWAQAEIVPELVGKLQPEVVGDMVIDFLENPEKLAAMREKLRSARGEGGAAQKLAALVKEEIEKF
ncbi:lipid-A-disaccharide synthase [Sphaerospermopsis aphanizomenoides BCCUSP55]|uniref:lipid-A-disaccharide synthase n=1 Tax=Sphaerospermopsis aphanizomenoides TaxID=459663 RepID=UPI001906EF8C|nr:lipid-A-disaccharide synthase [Sphaerospermopsis aphanizomenoides]MBK1988844.1 lipid-A-disaccharide synthase [Sphaerospermopsis aphanizomenoides BCCUSP55]